jgi:hypothetical protein
VARGRRSLYDAFGSGFALVVAAARTGAQIALAWQEARARRAARGRPPPRFHADLYRAELTLPTRHTSRRGAAGRRRPRAGAVARSERNGIDARHALGPVGPRVVLIHGGGQGSPRAGEVNFANQKRLAERGWQLSCPTGRDTAESRPGPADDAELDGALVAELSRTRAPGGTLVRRAARWRR